MTLFLRLPKCLLIIVTGKNIRENEVKLTLEITESVKKRALIVTDEHHNISTAVKSISAQIPVLMNNGDNIKVKV